MGFALLLLAGSGAAAASTEGEGKDSFNVYPTAGIGLNKLRFERADGSVTHATYPTLNLDVTARVGALYAKVGGELFGRDYVRDGAEMKSIERDDYTATLGFIVARRINLFAGYTRGEMKDDFLGLFHEDRGFFGGAAYTFFFGESSLGLSVAYASLDGRILDEASGVEETGDTRGFSYALTWSGPFRRTLAYQLGARVRFYEFEAASGDVTEKTFGAVFAGISF